MGLVEIIPGISGGTIALILGVYERLILAISKINIFFLVKVCSGKFKEAWAGVLEKLIKISLNVGGKTYKGLAGFATMMGDLIG